MVIDKELVSNTLVQIVWAVRKNKTKNEKKKKKNFYQI